MKNAEKGNRHLRRASKAQLQAARPKHPAHPKHGSHNLAVALPRCQILYLFILTHFISRSSISLAGLTHYVAAQILLGLRRERCTPAGRMWPVFSFLMDLCLCLSLNYTGGKKYLHVTKISDRFTACIACTFFLGYFCSSLHPHVNLYIMNIETLYMVWAWN